MKITNNSKALQGVQSVAGTVFIKPGQAKDVKMDEAGYKLASRLPFLVIDDRMEDDAPILQSEPAALAYEVKETSPGWYGVFKDGEQVGKSMRHDDAEAFKALSAEEQAAYLEG